MAEKWYKNSYLRLLTDMHIPETRPEFFTKFDPQTYIEQMSSTGIDTVYLYANSCVGLCNWPTKVGHMHKGHGGKDVLRELTEGFAKKGINVIVYINIWSKDAYEHHPDWRCKAPDGRESLEYMFEQPGRYGVLCLNSPYKEYVLQMVDELGSSYDFQGLWVDMILWRTMCTCDHCRARFARETGYDLPTTIDWASPVWNAYLKKRQEWVSEFFAAIIDRLHVHKPDATVMCNSSYFPIPIMGESLDFYRLGEFVGGDFNMSREGHSFECKLYRGVSANKPFEFLGSVMDPSLYEHVILKSKEHMLSLMFSCLMNNGRYGFIDAVDPCGTTNPKVVELMRELAQVEKQYEPFLSNDVRFCADVGLYVSLPSVLDMEDNGKPLQDWIDGTHAKTVRGAAQVLVRKHIPFDIITKFDLAELSQYKCIVLSQTVKLDFEEIQALRDYVANGGNIYASGSISYYDQDGNVCEGGLLSDVLGVTLLGKTQEKITYMRPANGGIVTGDYTDTHPLSFCQEQCLVKADSDRTVLAYLTLPYTCPTDATQFASAIADPPGIATDYPSIVFGSYQKGTVLYSACSLELADNYERENAFVRALSYLLPKQPTFCSDAPACVEITLYEQAENHRYVLNLLNFQKELPSIPVYNTCVRVAVDKPIRAVTSAPDGASVPFRYEDGALVLEIDKIDIFRMLLLEY